MVDRLLWSNGQTTRTSFRVPADNPLVENDRLSAAGLMENIAQTAAAGAGYAARGIAESSRVSNRGEIAPIKPIPPTKTSVTPRTGFIASVKNLEIFTLPEIEAELLTEITVTDRVADIIVISGKTTCGGKVIATGEMKILTSV
jgi:predicted hotdog family 3-hydroxylacyl-ACP dehydratase